jgi:fatty acid desaturase
MSIPLSPTETARYQKLNYAMGLAFGAANLAVLLLLPILIRFNALALGKSWAFWAVPVALLSNGFWALQHEAIHNLFAGDQADNKRAGRAMGVLFGSSFRILRFGHLMHHRFNRHPLDRPDSYDRASDSAFKARLRFFSEIFGGLYVIEVLTPLLYWLPQRSVHRLLDRVYAGEDRRLRQLRQLAQQALGSTRAIREVRADAAAVLLLYGGAFALWGKLWWILLAFMLVRGMLISFLDNIYHFRTPIDRSDFAFNLKLARPFRSLILNMNFHRVHHTHMNLPWWSLPRQFARTGDTFDGGYARAALAQLRGPAPTDMLIREK